MTVRAGREFLAIPGPTTMPDEVLQAMHRPALDIYSDQMVQLTESLRSGIVLGRRKRGVERNHTGAARRQRLHKRSI